MRERILQILEGYDTDLGADDNGDIVYGISSDQFDDVVQDIMEVIEEEAADNKAFEDFIKNDTLTSDDEPYHNLPNMVFMDGPCPAPKTTTKKSFGTRYITKR